MIQTSHFQPQKRPKQYFGSHFCKGFKVEIKEDGRVYCPYCGEILHLK